YVREELRSLLDWLNSYGQSLEALVCATVMFHEFESIHPFEDGNGRVGRTLFHLLLQDMGLTNSKLCKIELQLLQEPSIYYSLLAYADESGSYRELVEYFALCVLNAYEEAVNAFGSKDLASNGLDEATLRLVQKARELNDWFAVKDAVSWVEGLGEQSVRKRLNELVGIGSLTKEGRTMSTRFKFLDPFEPFKAKAQEKGYLKLKMA
ncbi:MAG: Fic family protein, partial [Methanomassiliicoccales archaeon]|nr:Fic family protein [Methanomassiliicoccales archaeon]